MRRLLKKIDLAHYFEITAGLFLLINLILVPVCLYTGNWWPELGVGENTVIWGLFAVVVRKLS